MIIVNSSFVGGLGGARKAFDLLRYLRERCIPALFMTDQNSLAKVRKIGLEPNIIVPNPAGKGDGEIRTRIAAALKGVEFDALVSFGWRTYVPAAALERGKSAFIVDGGWPERFGPPHSAFCGEVYRNLAAYCLTTHFYHPEMDGFLPKDQSIRFEWIAQPLSLSEIDWHCQVGKKRRRVRRTLPYYRQRYKSIFLNMNPECIDPWQGEFTGGWLSPEQLDECLGFVTRLIAELDRLSRRRKLTLVLHRRIAEQFAPILKKCSALEIHPFASMTPHEHHRFRSGAHLVLLRATRNVSSAQCALSALPRLRIVCPRRGDYMREASCGRLASELGLADEINHLEESLAEGIDRYLADDQRLLKAKHAQKLTRAFLDQRGLSYLTRDVLQLS